MPALVRSLLGHLYIIYRPTRIVRITSVPCNTSAYYLVTHRLL